MATLVGKKIVTSKAEYLFEILLSQGGQATVYRLVAFDLDGHNPRWVVGKVFTKQERHFEREMFIYERLAEVVLFTPYLLRMLDEFVIDGKSVLVLEYVTGTTITSWLASVQKGKKKRFEIDQLIKLAEQISMAVDFMHETSIVNMDIKTNNLMMTDSGYIKMLDLGLACKFVTPTPSVVAQPEFMCADDYAVGTMYYAAPEVFDGVKRNGMEYAKADIYSLGLLFYELFEERFINHVEWNAFRTVMWKFKRPSLENASFKTTRFSYPTPNFQKLIIRMVDFDFTARPTIKQVLAELRTMLETRSF